MWHSALRPKGAFTADMIKSMAAKPIIFALANPDPEITAEEVAQVRDDAIMATGRSDYPNQVKNILGFPFIFRGALDVRASTINMEMKIAAARALADLTREDVPDEVAAVYGARPKYGPEYIIPVPFDPRLISRYRRRWPKPPWIPASPVSRSSTWMSTASNCARVAIRSREHSRWCSAACAGSPSVWCSPRAKSSRCPGGGELRPSGPGDGGAGRPRGPGARSRARGRHRARRRHRDHQCAGVDTQHNLYQPLV